MTAATRLRDRMEASLPHGNRAHFLDTLRDGVVVIGADLTISFFNANYLTQLGLQSGDIAVGDRLEDVLRMLAWRGKLGAREGETVEQIVARRMAAWKSNDTQVERRVIDTGRVLDIYRAATIHDEFVAVHVDVTDRILAEQENERMRLSMKLLLDNASDGITLLDGDGRFVMFNDRFAQLYLIDPAKVRWGMGFRELAEQMGDLAGLPAEVRRAEIEARERLATDPAATGWRRKLADGRTLNVQKRNLPDGGCVMTIRDMTEELRREQELLDARNVAEQTARHKADFVARMSHEMRTPLNGILGVAALLRRAAPEPRLQELIRTIASSGSVLLRLIDDILDLSRLDAEPFRPIIEDFDIVRLLEECLGIIEPSAAEKGLALHLRRPPAPIPMLSGDAVRVKQIVLNLLTNAVKFTEAGLVETAVDGTAAPDGVALRITVADTGCGIAAEKIERIFDSFYQIDSTVTRRYGGAGLGLAITRRLVEAMGGTIEVDSEPGDGAAFIVRMKLPLAKSAPVV